MTKRWMPPSLVTIKAVKADCLKLPERHRQLRLEQIKRHWPKLYEPVLLQLDLQGAVPPVLQNNIGAQPQ